MRQLTLLLLLHQTLGQFFNFEECLIDYRSMENMWEHKLVHDLQECAYLYRPPTQNGTEPLQVNLRFSMKTFKYDSEQQEFSVYTWTFIKWKDERLKWDPKKYDGIDSAVLTSAKLWIPSLRLMNSLGDDYDERYLYVPCEVDSLGIVQCIEWVVWSAKCATDLKDWPYDAQVCKLEFGHYVEKRIKLLLDVGPRAITMIGAEYGAEWDIMDYQQEIDQTSDKQLIMTFRLERHAGVLSPIVIYPSIILTVLTLSTLLVDARHNSRSLVVCFSLMCHFYFLSELAFDIPKHSKEPPRLLLYYRGSFIVTFLLTVLSFIMNLVCKKETKCPNWIISFNNFVYTKFVKFLILPRWESNVEENKSATKFGKDWTDFVNVVNTVWIVVTVIVYVSLYCVFMPHPIPFEV